MGFDTDQTNNWAMPTVTICIHIDVTGVGYVKQGDLQRDQIWPGEELVAGRATGYVTLLWW